MISNKGERTTAINYRIGAANRVFYSNKNKKTKYSRRSSSPVIRPILIYAAEAMTKKGENELRIIETGVTRTKLKSIKISNTAY